MNNLTTTKKFQLVGLSEFAKQMPISKNGRSMPLNLALRVKSLAILYGYDNTQDQATTEKNKARIASGKKPLLTHSQKIANFATNNGIASYDEACFYYSIGQIKSIIRKGICRSWLSAIEYLETKQVCNRQIHDISVKRVDKKSVYYSQTRLSDKTIGKVINGLLADQAYYSDITNTTDRELSIDANLSLWYKQWYFDQSNKTKNNLLELARSTCDKSILTDGKTRAGLIHKEFSKLANSAYRIYERYIGRDNTKFGEFICLTRKFLQDVKPLTNSELKTAMIFRFVNRPEFYKDGKIDTCTIDFNRPVMLRERKPVLLNYAK